MKKQQKVSQQVEEFEQTYLLATLVGKHNILHSARMCRYELINQLKRLIVERGSYRRYDNWRNELFAKESAGFWLDLRGSKLSDLWIRSNEEMKTVPKIQKKKPPAPLPVKPLDSPDRSKLAISKRISKLPWV